MSGVVDALAEPTEIGFVDIDLLGKSIVVVSLGFRFGELD